MCSFVDIERRDKTVHPDGSEEVEVTPYNKVFIGEVRAAVLLMEEHLGWRVWPEPTTLWCYMRLSSWSWTSAGVDWLPAGGAVKLSYTSFAPLARCRSCCALTTATSAIRVNERCATWESARMTR